MSSGPIQKNVTIVLDGAPRPGLDPVGWRIEQISKEFAASEATTRLVVRQIEAPKSTFFGVVPDAGILSAEIPWLEEPSDLYFFCANGNTYRMVSMCRKHKPDAVIIIDASNLLSIQRPDIEDGYVTQLERDGRDTVASLRRQRDREILNFVDEVWVYSDVQRLLVSALGVSAKIRVVRPPNSRLGPSTRKRPLVFAAPHRDFCEPDIEACQYMNDRVLPNLELEESPLLISEREFTPWNHTLENLDRTERDGNLSEPLSQASMVIAARQSGPTPWSQFLAARAVDAPIIATSAAVAHIDTPDDWNIEVVERSQIASSIQRTAELNRSATSNSDHATGIKTALEEHGIKPSPSEIPITDWLTTSEIGKRHKMGVKQYRRSLAAAVNDPDLDNGASLPYRPLISILTPVYNTPLEILRSTIESVRLQIYENWQLCLVDDCSTDNGVRTVCKELAAKDPRIDFVERSSNGGIAEASNTAFEMAEGEFVALLDHDDLLRSDALVEVVRALNEFPNTEFLYSDEDKLFADGSYDHSYAKSGWSPDLHLSYNYICHFAVINKALIMRLGGWRQGFDGAQDYDLLLRVTEATSQILHIPRNLYHWRVIAGSTAAGIDQKDDAWAAGQRALSEALTRRHIDATVEEGLEAGTYNLRYQTFGQPKVGIIITTRDRYELISQCVEGVANRTSWQETEIMVINNESTDEATLRWLDSHAGPVIDFPHQFSYARMMNMAAEQIDCDLLLFLNCDIEITQPEWLESMIGLAQQSRVGAVGAKLTFPGGQVQHEGVAVGVGGAAVNINSRGYFSIGNLVRNCWALTAACLMVRPEVFWEVGGFEERLRVAFNDVDLTMRIHQLGYDLVYQPHANLLHQESALRGSLHPAEDEVFFRNRWGDPLNADDPYYNPRLSRHAQYYFADDVKQVWLPRGHPLA